MEKKFVIVGMDASMDSFTLEEEKENGDLSEDQLKMLDSIQVGEHFNANEGIQYERIQ